jgi:membrane protein DedA with SNARE-associated domain
MEEFFANYGLFAVFIAAAFEGDIAFLAAGVLAHLGYFPAYQAAILGLVGVLGGDSLWYGLGRWRADWVKSTHFWRRIGRPVERLFLRFGPGQIIAARFIYGIRIASMLFWGIQRLPYRRFVGFNFLGATPWAILLTTLGYVLSFSVEALMGKFKQLRLALLLGLLAGWAIFVGVNLLLRRLMNATDAKDQEENPLKTRDASNR